MLTKQKLPLYERFSELCRIAAAQAQSRIQFNFAMGAFCDQPIKWLDKCEIT